MPSRLSDIASTSRKRYQYFIWHDEDRPLFFPDLAWHRWQALDVDAMREAAAHFVGTHDFASFARPGHGREHTQRTVWACDVSARLPKIVIGVEGLRDDSSQRLRSVLSLPFRAAASVLPMPSSSSREPVSVLQE